VPEPGALVALAATCHRLTETLPTGEVASAKQRAGSALATLTAAGTSTNPRFQAATGELAALIADLDTVTASLAAATEHVRAFRGRLT